MAQMKNTLQRCWSTKWSIKPGPGIKKQSRTQLSGRTKAQFNSRNQNHCKSIEKKNQQSSHP